MDQDHRLRQATNIMSYIRTLSS